MPDRNPTLLLWKNLLMTRLYKNMLGTEARSSYPENAPNYQYTALCVHQLLAYTALCVHQLLASRRRRMLGWECYCVHIILPILLFDSICSTSYI
jgi:hypothetical protein